MPNLDTTRSESTGQVALDVASIAEAIAKSDTLQAGETIAGAGEVNSFGGRQWVSLSDNAVVPDPLTVAALELSADFEEYPADLIAGVFADLENAADVHSTWSALDLVTMFQRHPEPLPADGVLLFGHNYYGSEGTYTLANWASNIVDGVERNSKWLKLEQISSLNEDKTPSVTGTFKFSSTGEIFTGTLSASPNFRWHLYWIDADSAWLIHSNRELVIPINSLDDPDAKLTRANRYNAFNGTSDEWTLVVPGGSPAGKIVFRYDRNSSGPIRIESADGDTFPHRLNLNGNVNWFQNIGIEYIGRLVTLEANPMTGRWNIYIEASSADNRNLRHWEPGDGSTDIKYAAGDQVIVPIPVNADWIANDGAIRDVNYIVEAVNDRPNTVTVFDDVEADSGDWELIGIFRTSGNEFPTMRGTGTQSLSLNDITSTEAKQHTIPEGVTQAYIYSGNPASISVFDDLLGTVETTVVDSTTGVLSREFSVTGPARMTFTKFGNSPQFTFVSNDGGESIPRRTYSVSGAISDENQKAIFYNDTALAMTVNSATDRQIVLIRSGSDNVVITDAGGKMFRQEDPNNPGEILPDEMSITLNTNSTWTMDFDEDLDRWVVSDGDTSGAPVDALEIVPNRIWKQQITDLDNGSPQDFEFTTPGNSGDYRLRMSNRTSGNGNAFVQVFDDAARTNIIADGINNRIQLDGSGEGTTDLLIESLAANTTYYLRFSGGGSSSNGEFIAAIYFDEGGTVSQVDLSQYTIDTGVDDGDYLILDVTNQRIIKGDPPASSTYSKVGDVHVEEGAVTVRMWGRATSVDTITLPVEVADISECEIHITTEGSTERHILPDLETSNGTTLDVARVGNTGATFFWSVYGVKSGN